MRGLSPVVASGGHSSSWCAGLSLSRPLVVEHGSRRTGSVVVARGLSCSVACGIFPDQGSNPCPLHRQADSEPLRHQGSPLFHAITFLPLLLPSIFIFTYVCMYVCIYVWLRWVFVAACRLSLVVASGGYSSLRCAGFSLRWLLLLWSMGSRRAGFSSCGTRAQQLWLAGSRAQAQ